MSWELRHFDRNDIATVFHVRDVKANEIFTDYRGREWYALTNEKDGMIMAILRDRCGLEWIDD